MQFKEGDFVQVVAGPAYVENGRRIKGRVTEVTPTPQPDDPKDAEVIVRVSTGGQWGFRSGHLAILSKRERAK